MSALTRRGLLAGGIATFAASRAWAFEEEAVPSAAALAKAVNPPRDASALLMKDETGTRVPLSQFAGELLVVNLWAPWCVPCRREMPSLARLAEAMAGQPVRVLPLAFDWRGASGVRRFYKEIGVASLPILIGDGQNLMATLGLEHIPTTAVIDGTGRHIATVAGEAEWDDAETRDWLLGLI